jgi:hypothetical protein
MEKFRKKAFNGKNVLAVPVPPQSAAFVARANASAGMFDWAATCLLLANNPVGRMSMPAGKRHRPSASICSHCGPTFFTGSWETSL